MKPINLFIDTSIFINFYSNSEDEIKELHKLIELIKNDLLHLYLPEHIKNEFMRRRDEVINSTLENFKNDLSQKIPILMNHLSDDSENYRRACIEVQRTHTKLLNTARAEAISQTLPADKLFNDICKEAALIPLDPEVKKEAEQRVFLENPPGKKNSPGDRLIWETLLKEVPYKTDLHIVAVDKDYYSILKKGDLHPFLLREWSEKKAGQLFTYQTLTPFFNDFFPDINVSSVIERHLAISMLNNSNTFAESHDAIAQLTPYISTLTDREKDELFDIAETNTQISWIRTDSDVQEFYKKILKNCSDRYTPGRISTLEEFFGLPK